MKKVGPLEIISICISLLGIVFAIVEYNSKTSKVTDFSAMSTLNKANESMMDNASENAGYILNEDTILFPVDKEISLPNTSEIESLRDKFNNELSIVLHTDTPYVGIDAWDAMQSVGLKHHRQDQLFYWDSDSVEGLSFFCVSTSTYPFHFKHAAIQSGQLKPEDLIFTFQIPLCPEPEKVYGIMHNAAKYCQQRLGGSLQTKDGEVFNFKKSLNQVKANVKKLRAKGIEPGSQKAKIIFG